ncbi:MAG: winged helix-turn-helix domain-containing protein [Acidobacteriota bacterium]
MESTRYAGAYRFEELWFDAASGDLSGASGTIRLEPKVARLLELLVSRPGTLVGRGEITDVLWPDVVVGDEAMARCVSKLRKALGDDPRSPRFVETVPKRGYRWLTDVEAPPAVPPSPSPESPRAESPEPQSEGAAAPEPGPDPPRPRRAVPPAAALLVILVVLGLGLWILGDGSNAPTGEAPGEGIPPLQGAESTDLLADRANDFYFQYTRADNESAIELYERAIAGDPDSASAQAGLANALVQKVLRWPSDADAPQIETVDLAHALDSGRLRTTEAQQYLGRANALAERAVRLAPSSAAAHKAYGFVQSALEHHDDAIRAYQRAVELDGDAWGALINLGDVHGILGRDDEALAYFEQAYHAMTRVYSEQAPRVRPWHAELGVAIAERHAAAGRPQDAEVWFRRVLAYAPFHPGATRGLAGILEASGDAAAARRLCLELEERTGVVDPCVPPQP